MDFEQKSSLSINQVINITLIVLIVALTYIYFKDNFNSLFQKQEIEQPIEKKKIIVNIEGAVNNPGIYELEEGNRINDIILLADGFTSDADIPRIALEINKAEKLTDGKKIFIPYTGQLATTEQSNTENLKVNINSSDLKSLDTLPGIGEVSAQKIIDGRPYSTIDELVDKKIIGKSQLEKIIDLIEL